MPATLSAVVAVVPEAEPAVAQWRAELDRATALGVPAHVTVLYPFVPPDQLTTGVVDALRAVVTRTPAFDVTFADTGWFGQDVVWLSPTPAEPFRALTAAVWRAFPQHPPYGGIFPEVVPHLTIGERAPLPRLRAAEAAVRRDLPVVAPVREVSLLAGSHEPDSWRVLETLPLRGA